MLDKLDARQLNWAAKVSWRKLMTKGFVQRKGMDKMKDLFTTGEAAEICKISQQTIIRCFDAGRLEGFRVPGSRFRRIPRQSLVKFMKENKIPLDSIESGKRKVLIVDDDAEIIELIVDVLNRDGRFETKTASSGYEAGMATEKFRPELILLDYMLPDVNGNVVCQTIRKNPEFENIKIIIVSGVVKQDEIAQLLKSGAQDFIRKPFDVTELTGKITSVLQMK
jgi:excisionase family DNA binding protein